MAGNRPGADTQLDEMDFASGEPDDMLHVEPATDGMPEEESATRATSSTEGYVQTVQRAGYCRGLDVAGL